ncbi:DNA alkylation repair protein [Labilibacter marinus]|uniref:DNA alkylation repair protein n=1 Tax=Labilibacter marinus TaxID=1477105 RepID=UPI000837574A|nr:DNA alkylation repair protein [Labilibacter marinus]
MAEPLKNMINPKLVEQVGNQLIQIKSDFNKDAFIKEVFDNNWENLELKDRMNHVAYIMGQHLPADYAESIEIVLALTNLAQNDSKEMSFVYMFLPSYVEQFGIQDTATSVKAMERITQFSSCEFAVRPFIINNQDIMMEQMLNWSMHEHENVRRFSSEGCRPRLPWAMGLPELKKDPAPIMPILENLKDDASEFVRKSVANNLNDISKDHPELVLSIAKRWQGKSKNTDWIIKHGLRTLLKAGNQTALEMFGFGSSKDIKAENFKVITPLVKLGDYLEFSFDINNTSNSDSNIRLEYAVYYQKANGSLAKKVYKISEKMYAANSTSNIKRRQSFKVISTRKFHEGLHQVALVINGIEMEKHDFELTFE